MKIILEKESGVVDIGGKRIVMLTERERAIMGMLLDAEGNVVTRRDIGREVLGRTFSNSNVVDAHIRNLRNKCGRDVIATVRGQGYRIPQKV